MEVKTVALADHHYKLLLDGRLCHGNVMVGKACRLCGQQTVIYENVFDAPFCWSCNQWLETACDSPTCGYCRNRPERPLPAVLDDDGPDKASYWNGWGFVEPDGEVGDEADEGS